MKKYNLDDLVSKIDESNLHKEIPLGVRVCLNCGKDISDKNLGAKYCSTSCRVSWNNKQKRRLQKEQEEERTEAQKQMPDKVVWMVKNRKWLFVCLGMLLVIILQFIIIFNLLN